VFERLPLTEPQLLSLAQRLPAAGHWKRRRLLSALEKSKSAAVKRARESAAAKSKSLHPPELVSASRRRKKLAEVEPLLTGGNGSRGQAVFFGQPRHVYDVPRRRGPRRARRPDLTRIGAARVRPRSARIHRLPQQYDRARVRAVRRRDTPTVSLRGTLAGESADAIRLRTPAEQSSRARR
jgi:hypothetical protein